MDSMLTRLLQAQAGAGQSTVVFGACAFTLLGSLLLGGGTRAGFLSDAVLQLLAIPALLLSLASLLELRFSDADARQPAYRLLPFCVAILFVPLIQLLPLPPWIWSSLPGRDVVIAVFDTIGVARPWMPISVSPTATSVSILSLLPPAAIFLGAVQLGQRERRWLSLVIIAVGVASAFLGLLQVAQGAASPLRFFTITNNTEPVGFFANKNHFAALMYVAFLLTAVWAIDAAFKVESWRDIARLEPGGTLAFVAAFLALLILLACEVIATSRAGLILTMVALVGIFALAATDQRNASGITPRKLLAGVVVLAIGLTAQFALYRVLERFGHDPLDDWRVLFAHNTFHAAMAFMPFGAGVGTFVPVYQMFEPAGGTLPNVYVNHAHNDILEVWLETGIMGVILFSLFVTWLAHRSIKLWRGPSVHYNGLDWSLARAAALVVGLLVIHSFFDYPMRTAALMAVFAFCCALLVEPLQLDEELPRVHQATSAQSTPAMTLVAASTKPALPLNVAVNRKRGIADDDTNQPGGRWGEDIEWPEEWRKSDDKKTG